MSRWLVAALFPNAPAVTRSPLRRNRSVSRRSRQLLLATLAWSCGDAAAPEPVARPIDWAAYTWSLSWECSDALVARPPTPAQLFQLDSLKYALRQDSAAYPGTGPYIDYLVVAQLWFSGPQTYWWADGVVDTNTVPGFWLRVDSQVRTDPNTVLSDSLVPTNVGTFYRTAGDSMAFRGPSQCGNEFSGKGAATLVRRRP